MEVFDVIAPRSYMDRTRILIKEEDNYFRFYYSYNDTRGNLIPSCFNNEFETEEEAIRVMEAYDKKYDLKTTYLGTIL